MGCVLIQGFVRSVAAIALLATVAWNADAQGSSAESYSENPEDIAQGEKLFQVSCAACHNFSRQGAIGPGLGRVTREAEKSWIIDFIKDSQAMIQAGDLRALELFDEYKTMMPAYDLPDSDMEALLAYIYSQKRERRQRRPETIREGVLSNPLAETAEPAGIGLVLEEFVRVPHSKRFAAQAKINKMEGVIDGERHRLFVNDIRGFLYEIIEGEVVTFLDIGSRFPDFVNEPGFATGLPSYAFSPDFEKDGLLYTHHAETPKAKVSDFALPEGNTPVLQYVVTEWKTDTEHVKILPGQGRELLRVDMNGNAHAMQEIAFNPTVEKGNTDYGLLYIGIGDGAASYDNRPDLFDSNRLIWGKILRIDPSGNNAANGRYGIPANNPFVVKASIAESDKAEKGEETLEEIFATGFRNPNTITWDQYGRMLVTDIGHHNIEEVNWVEAGMDYGWPSYEGKFEIDLNGRQRSLYPRESNDRNSVDPVMMLDHDDINAIAGGYAIFDESLAELEGKYLFGGIVSGRVFMIDTVDLKQGERPTPQELGLIVDDELQTFTQLVKYRRADLRFGQDSQHGLYLMSKTNGCIWKVVGTQHLNEN